MKAIAELIIALLELLESEARAARDQLRRLGLGLGLLAGAGIIGLAGLALALGALYLYLAETFDPASSVLLTGIACLLVAGALLWAASRATK